MLYKISEFSPHTFQNNQSKVIFILENGIMHFDRFVRFAGGGVQFLELCLYKFFRQPVLKEYLNILI